MNQKKLSIVITGGDRIVYGADDIIIENAVEIDII